MKWNESCLIRSNFHQADGGLHTGCYNRKCVEIMICDPLVALNLLHVILMAYPYQLQGP